MRIFEERTHEETEVPSESELNSVVSRSITDIALSQATNYADNIFRVDVDGSRCGLTDSAAASPKFVVFRQKQIVYDGQESILLTMTDVTTTLKYNKSERDLELLNSLQASVSHDMKAPISVISLTLGLVIQKKIVTDPAVVRLLKPVLSASKVLFF